MDLAFVGRLLAAGAVIALVLAGVQFVARASVRVRLRSSTSHKLLAVVETTHLPNASSLHVIRAAERYYVVGLSGTCIATLCEIPAQSVGESLARPAAGAPAMNSFAGFISRLHR